MMGTILNLDKENRSPEGRCFRSVKTIRKKQMQIERYSILTVKLFVVVAIFTCDVHAQEKSVSDFSHLIMTDIPGAPKLEQPRLILSQTEEPIIGQGFGLAAPAFYDWNGDGLKDLLIGEFGSGAEFGRNTGNFIRVYLNKGTQSQPAFLSKFNYARPPFEVFNNGTPYSVDQFCCLGFRPEFLDLDNDSLQDLVSGNYFGEVLWFRGSHQGFEIGKPLLQEGTPRPTDWRTRLKGQPYWSYSSVSFGDLTGDGKSDLIVGGRALRMSENIGSQNEPKFSKRQMLLDVKGNPLKVYDYTTMELDSFRGVYSNDRHNIIPDFNPPYTAGDHKISPLVTDWDGDGVLDLLVTNSYDHRGLEAIDFFRGIKINGEHRFEEKLPLFRSKDKGKALPGIAPFIYVTDWNGDSIPDLLIGTSVVTIDSKFNEYFSWNWERETGLKGTAKDPGFLHNAEYSISIIRSITKDVKIPLGVSEESLMKIHHQGFIYLMIGRRDAPKDSE
jgi:hypothetical protein